MKARYEHNRIIKYEYVAVKYYRIFVTLFTQARLFDIGVPERSNIHTAQGCS
jgi:hypothetical protein